MFENMVAKGVRERKGKERDLRTPSVMEFFESSI